MAHQEINPEQPLLPGFEPIQGVDVRIPEDELREVATRIARVGRGHLPVEPRVSEAYAELGGGSREDATTAYPRPPRTPRNSRPTGHVRDTEPRDSDVDPYWSGPVEVPAPQDSTRIKEHIETARGLVRRGVAERDFADLQQFPASQQAAILRAREERKRQ